MRTKKWEWHELLDTEMVKSGTIKLTSCDNLAVCSSSSWCRVTYSISFSRRKTRSWAEEAGEVTGRAWTASPSRARRKRASRRSAAACPPGSAALTTCSPTPMASSSSPSSSNRSSATRTSTSGVRVSAIVCSRMDRSGWRPLAASLSVISRLGPPNQSTWTGR